MNWRAMMAVIAGAFSLCTIVQGIENGLPYPTNPRPRLVWAFAVAATISWALVAGMS